MRAHRIDFRTGTIETWEWKEGEPVAIVAELRPHDRKNIASMIPSATLFAVFDDTDVDPEELAEKLDEIKRRPDAYRGSDDDNERR